MTHVTVALTQQQFAVWDTHTQRLRLLWDVADVVVKVCVCVCLFV